MTVRRFDQAELGKAVRTEAGFLRVPATLTRTGVFPYQQPDGTIRRELRLPEEVFRADSLDSLQAAPLTLEHPPEAVTPTNVRTYAVGSVGTDARADGDYVRGTVMITAADAIAAVESGRMQELSCGYDCRLDETPGTWNGQAYDAIQRDVVYNHLALVPVGRAGPQVRLHLDAADAVMVPRKDDIEPPREPEGAEAPKKLRLRDAEFELPAEVVRAFAELEQEVDELQQQLDEANEARSTLEAERDAAQEAAESAKAERADALRPESIRALVAARVSLETTAREILRESFRADASDEELRLAVVQALSPTSRIDSTDPGYIAARFDQAVEQHRAQAGFRLGFIRAAAEAGGGARYDAESRREAMVRRNLDAWKQPLSARKER